MVIFKSEVFSDGVLGLSYWGWSLVFIFRFHDVDVDVGEKVGESS